MARGDTKRVKPLEGLLVRDPKTMTPLPAAGAVVPWNSYWRRRFKDGSIEIVPEIGPSSRTTSRTASPQGRDKKEE